MAATVRFINPTTLAKPPGYTSVVETTGPGRTVYIAGQLGLDMENKLVGNDFRAQCTKAFENLKAAVAGVGGTVKDIVKINNYLTDMSHIGTFREIRDQQLNMAAPPASTTVAISTLARPGALFEIEAIAVLPPAKAARPAKARGASRSAKAKASRRKRK